MAAAILIAAAARPMAAVLRGRAQALAALARRLECLPCGERSTFALLSVAGSSAGHRVWRHRVASGNGVTAMDINRMNSPVHR